MDNKNIFASNLKRYMKENHKNRREVCESIGVSYYTFSDWVNGKKYPRMDKVEKLANYFGILKSDLIEDKPKEHHEMQEKNSTITDIIVRMRTDSDFLSVVEALSGLDAEKLASVKQMLSAFMK